MSTSPIPRVTLEEYFEMDRRSEVPLEYHDGEVFPIEGATLWHGNIVANLANALAPHLKGRGCRATMTVRVRPRAGKYLYPDLMVYCGKPQLLGEAETLANPTIVFEVSSPTTRNYDYGEKFILYRKLRSLREYVLIAQDQPLIEIYHFNDDGTWKLSSHSGLTAWATLESLGASLSLGDIYADVSFPETPEE